MKPSKAWDSVSEKFNTFKKKPYAGALDNTLTVWPVAKNYIKRHLKNSRGQKALEYGCGAGHFCLELNKLGFKTTGIDIARKMIKIGKKYLPKEVELLVGDHKTALNNSQRKGKFSFVCGIMVFQFVKDINKCMSSLSKSLVKGGHLFFAVHDPRILKARNIKNKFKLEGMADPVKIFPRNAKAYTQILKGLGFMKILEKHIDYDPKFKRLYGRDITKKTPKYLILGYKKLK